MNFKEENSSWITRTDLLEQMGASAGVIILHAEGGAGKTTLAHQWAMRHRSHARVAWVSCDNHDCNIEVAWRKVLNVLRSIAPARFNVIVRDFANGMLETEELPSVLLTYIIEAGEELAIVFDDFHLVAEEFQKQLVNIYRSAPTLTLLVTSREPTLFNTSSCIQGADMREILSGDLAFSATETEELIRSLAPGASSSLARSIRRATNGHVLAIRLFALQIAGMADWSNAVTIGDGFLGANTRDILRYLPSLSESEEKELALRASLCPEVTPALARRLSGSAEAWERFRAFARLGLGSVVRDGRETSAFRFHALVKAALRSEAEKTLSNREVVRVRALAFSELEGVSDPVDVFELGIAAHNDEGLFRYFIHAFVELSIVRSKECLDIVSRVDFERVSSSWQISLIWAILLIENTAGSPKQSVQLARIAERNLRNLRLDSSAVDQAYIALARVAIYRIERKFGALSVAVKEFVRRVEAISEVPAGKRPRDWGSALFQAHLSLLLVGDLNGAIQVGAALKGDAVVMRQVRLDSSMALIFCIQGEFALARRRVESLKTRKLPPGWKESPLSLGHTIAETLLVLGSEGAPDSLGQLEEDRLDLRRLEMWPAVLWARAKMRLYRGEPDRGLSELEKSLAGHSDLPISEWWSRRLRICVAEFYLACERASEARASIRGLEGEADVDLLKILLSLASGDLESAHAGISDLCSSSGVPPLQRGAGLLLRAGLEGKLGHFQLSACQARRALDEIALTESRLSFAYIPEGMREVLAEVAPDLAEWSLSGSSFRFSVLSKSLTRREAEIVTLLASPATLDRIASDLYISRNTLKSHLRSIYRKLGVSGRKEAVAAQAARSA